MVAKNTIRRMSLAEIEAKCNELEPKKRHSFRDRAEGITQLQRLLEISNKRERAQGSVKELSMDALRDALTGTQKGIADLASALGVTERQIRMGIDRLRADGINVHRSGLRVFTIAAKRKRAR